MTTSHKTPSIVRPEVDGQCNPPSLIIDSPNLVLFGVEMQSACNSFVDRTGEPLETMQRRLEVKRLVILTGFAGMGKSELVKQFIRKVNKGTPTYKSIVWLAAGSDSLLLTKLSELAKNLKLEVQDGMTSEKIWQIFVKNMVNGEKRLIVFDNVGDISMLKGFTREGFNKSHVIITTRHSHGSSELRGEMLSLEKLTTRQAVQIFETEYVQQFGDVPTPSDDQIVALVNTVGKHPASICHIVRYLQETRTDTSDWLKVYKSSPWQFWNSETANIPSLASKLSASLLKISENADSIRLLCLLSFLQSDQIPIWLLRSNPWLQSQFLIEILKSDGDLNKALRPLSSWSVVDREGSRLLIHKIAQDITRVLLDNPEMDYGGILRHLGNDERSTRYWTERASELLYPLQGQFVWRSFADQDLIVEHTQTCLEYCHLYNIDSGISRALMHSFSAFVLLNTGEKPRSDLWKEPLREYEGIQENVIDLKQGLLCHLISLRFFILKNYDDATTASQKAIRSFEDLQETHGEWGLQYQYQLGCILYAQGSYRNAESQFQKVERSLARMPGDIEYQRVIPLLDLGRCLVAQDYYDRALEKFESAIRIVKAVDKCQITGCALPLILIGATYVRRDDFETANQYCDHAFGLYSREFAERHPKALIALTEHIALAFQALGQYKEALAWFEKVKFVCDSLYKRESVLCADILENMAVSFCCTDDYGEALRHFERAEGLYRTFANLDEAPDVFKLKVNERITRHAELLRRRSRYKDAISLRKCAIRLLEKPPLVRAVHKARQQKGLADLYERLGELDLARANLGAAFEVFKIALAHDNPELEQARDDLERLAKRQPGGDTSLQPLLIGLVVILVAILIMSMLSS